MTVVPVAQGTRKRTTMVKQTGLGVPGSTGGQILRRVTAVFSAERDTFDNPELVSHEQSTGVAYGMKKTSGKLAGILSPGTYKLIFAAACRSNFAAVTASTALSITITLNSGAWRLTRAAGSYITDGYNIGDIVQLTAGAFNAANLQKNLLIIALTGTIATVLPLNGVPLVNEGPITAATFKLIGKKAVPQSTGQTNDYFTVEEWYSDLGLSELFTDFKWNKIDVALPPSGNCTFSAEGVGLLRTLGQAQVLTTPTAETTNSVATAGDGAVFANGTIIVNSTGATLSIDGNMKIGDAILGSNVASDVARGRIKVTGTFMAQFSDQVISTLYETEAPLNLVLICAVDETASCDFMAFSMGRIKVTGDPPDDGEKQIVRSYSFEAEYNMLGGASVNTFNTILSVQDSQA